MQRVLLSHSIIKQEVSCQRLHSTGSPLLCLRVPSADHHWPIRPDPTAGARGAGTDQLPGCHSRTLQILLPASAALHGHRVEQRVSWAPAPTTSPKPPPTD